MSDLMDQAINSVIDEWAQLPSDVWTDPRFMKLDVALRLLHDVQLAVKNGSANAKHLAQNAIATRMREAILSVPACETGVVHSLADLRRLRGQFYAKYAKFPKHLKIPHASFCELVAEYDVWMIVDGVETIMGMTFEKVEDTEASVS